MEKLNLKRRFKRVPIASGLTPSKYELIALLKHLPPDAVLVSVYTSYQDDYETGYLVFHSYEWPIVDSNMQLESLVIEITKEEVDEAAGIKVVHKQEFQGKPFEFKLPPGMEFDPSLLDYQPQVGACICDMAYTGLRYHKNTCPHFRRS